MQLGTAIAVAALSLLRRRLPVSVLVVAAAMSGSVTGFSVLMIVAGWSAGRRIAGAGRALAAFTASYVLFIGVGTASAWPDFSPLTLGLVNTLYFLATTVVPGLATVKTYVSRILAKLECDNRVQAALLARDAEEFLRE
ncbi:hypothetical protein [Streptomyces sp. A5-4]|uniref:hypothetical protein n=1 Tax=Streptomyces sp. A5-4 TaxID=3384771 RepID=UPI003DA8F705